MIEALRFIPHPTYGNYGGRTKTCLSGLCPMPIDAMDDVFKRHDIRLATAQNKEERQEADKLLYKELKDIKPKYLKHKIYGRFYRSMCLIIFK